MKVGGFGGGGGGGSAGLGDLHHDEHDEEDDAGDGGADMIDHGATGMNASRPGRSLTFVVAFNRLEHISTIEIIYGSFCHSRPIAFTIFNAHSKWNGQSE